MSFKTPAALCRQSMGNASRPARVLVVLAVLLVASAATGSAAVARKRRAPIIHVLSNRADLISGGDALVSIDLKAGTNLRRVRVSLNGQDIRSSFAVRPNGLYEGLVTNLRNGENVLYARVGGRKQQITITDHPNGGPVLAGPQLQPWVCQSTAVDAQCNQPASYSYVYYSTEKSIKPYDPNNPPSDVETATTDQGVKVPWIVRIETGYEDRDQYQIATLFRPGRPWAPWAPQNQWNHKLVIIHGALCGVEHKTGTAPNITEQWIGVIGEGYMGMSTALDNAAHNCNLPLEAESLIMAKERIVEQYGQLRYTIGDGCSGGSLVEQWIANAYPGVYQGVVAQCSFPDSWSTATQLFDYHLLLAYFGNPSKWGTGVAWSSKQMDAVLGHPGGIANAEVSNSSLFHVAIPTDPCTGVTEAQRYQPQTNPGGVRCDIQDAAINVFGPRPAAEWSANERRIGHGFAGIPIDNVGVQYGVSALQAGEITPEDFVDLNEKIGGVDIDINPTASRLKATEAALANAYRSGMINETNNLDETAIIDCRGPDVAEGHDAYRAFALRARLDREHGTHANQLIWEGPAPYPGVGDESCVPNSFAAMDRWLTAVEKDTSPRPLAQKVIADKPSDLTDRCYDGAGNLVSETLCPESVVPIYGTPRTAAGNAITTDANKCQLKPLNRNDYQGVVPFTEAQWARLQSVFPLGVCDFSKPGVDQQQTIPWQTYQNDSAGGAVVYGGKPLGAAPAGSGEGWTSPAFSDWLAK
jgi:Tannase-like family of unknown function (DUF6351)